MRISQIGGHFYAWCESIGLKVKTVQNILAYHDLVRQNLPNQAMLEELPKSLVYEVARKSAPPELKQGVLNGDITTLKEYKALKAELEAEQRAQTQVADMKSHLKSAEAELSSIKVEMLHKQAEVDALKHEQKMQTEPQVVEIPDTTSREEIARLRDQLAQSRKTVERQEARAASAEKSLAYQMERASKAQAELQALKNGMSLQVYADDAKDWRRLH